MNLAFDLTIILMIYQSNSVFECLNMIHCIGCDNGVLSHFIITIRGQHKVVIVNNHHYSCLCRNNTNNNNVYLIGEFHL